MRNIVLTALFLSATCSAEAALWGCQVDNYFRTDIFKNIPVEASLYIKPGSEGQKTIVSDEKVEVTASNDDTTIFLKIKDKRPNGYTHVKSAPLTAGYINLELNDASLTGNKDLWESFVYISCNKIN